MEIINKIIGFLNEENASIKLYLNNGEEIKLKHADKIKEFDNYLLIEIDENKFEYILVDSISHLKFDKSPKIKKLTKKDFTI